MAEAPGRATFLAEADAGETSSLVRGFSSPCARAIDVSVTTVDAELAARGWAWIDILKIDAEGFDLHVIKGAAHTLREGRVGIVQFEYNAPWAAAGSTLAEAPEYLSACGYQIMLLKRNGLYIPRYDVYGEYFGYSNYVAVTPERFHDIQDLVRGEL